MGQNLEVSEYDLYLLILLQFDRKTLDSLNLCFVTKGISLQISQRKESFLTRLLEVASDVLEKKPLLPWVPVVDLKPQQAKEGG